MGTGQKAPAAQPPLCSALPRQRPAIAAESLRVAELLARAQGGQAAAVLAEVEPELRSVTGDLADGPAGLHFVRSVALVRLQPDRDHSASVELFVAACLREQSGWLPCAYAERAFTPFQRGSVDWEAPDSEAALHDLAAGEAALEAGDLDDIQRCNAHADLGIAYEMLRLYELAAPHFEAAHEVSTRVPEGAANPVLWSLNLAMVHLTWALELYRVQGTAEAEKHIDLAAGFARRAEAEAPEDELVWRHMARLCGACARADGDDVDGVAEELYDLIQTARQWDGVEVPAMAESFYAVALAKTGRADAAIVHLDQVIRACTGSVDTISEASVTHTRALLLARSGDERAVAALAYGDVLARALWQDRLRTVNAARTMRELTRLRLEHEDVTRSATTDPLTGVANRRALDDLLQTVASEAGSGPVAVMVVDVDHFKQINDSLGHDAGDTALRGIAEAVSACVRTGDTVARAGGDEFVVVLPGATRSVAAVVADRLVRAVEASGSCPTSVSVGVAVVPQAEVAAGLRSADACMYQAKRAGGGRWYLAPSAEATAGSAAARD